VVDTSSGQRQQLARLQASATKKKQLGRMLDPRWSENQPNSIVPNRGPTAPEAPSPYNGQTDLKYIGQRAGRGGADAIGGTPDMLNWLLNTGLRDYGALTGMKYDDVYQFPYASDQLANAATELTGARIVQPEEVSPSARALGTAAELGIGSLDPGALGGAKVAAKRIFRRR
jgi:hypothetical protein